jgi:hypothetical protein
MRQFFALLPEDTERFFELCLQREAVTEPERIAILAELAAEGKVIAAGETDLSDEAFAEKLAEHANVLRVKRK